MASPPPLPRLPGLSASPPLDSPSPPPEVPVADMNPDDVDEPPGPLRRPSLKKMLLVSLLLTFQGVEGLKGVSVEVLGYVRGVVVVEVEVQGQPHLLQLAVNLHKEA